MPSFFSFQSSVERFIPRRAAVPFEPPSTQPPSRSAGKWCQIKLSTRQAVHDSIGHHFSPFLDVEGIRIGHLRRPAQHVSEQQLHGRHVSAQVPRSLSAAAGGTGAAIP
jgi:hypothetical protein